MCFKNTRLDSTRPSGVVQQDAHLCHCQVGCESHNCQYKEMGQFKHTHCSLTTKRTETQKTEMKGVVIILFCYFYSIMLFMLASLIARIFLSLKAKVFPAIHQSSSIRPFYLKNLDLNGNRSLNSPRTSGER
ncbi:hypothetical protein ScPMuIL_013446 [Solemya velum]